MISVIVRSIRESDIEFVYALCKSEHWNYSRDNIERLSTCEQTRSFVAERNGKCVGHVFSISYGKLGWIGMLIVDKEHRRRGIGTLLMKRVMNHLLHSGVTTMKLIAAPEAANLYRKLGFIDEFESLEFTRVNKTNTCPSNLNIAQIKKNEIFEIAKFDSMYFGANRAQVLDYLCEDNPELCFASRINNQIVGYIMCHETEIGYRIGPWICNPDYPSIARELILYCMGNIEANAELCAMVPGANEAAVKLVQDLEFSLLLKGVHMYFGKKLENGRVKGIFSVGGPEKG